MENSIWHLSQRAAARIKGDRAWEGLSSSMKSAFNYAASTSFRVYCEQKPVLGRKMVIKNSTHTWLTHKARTWDAGKEGGTHMVRGNEIRGTLRRDRETVKHLPCRSRPNTGPQRRAEEDSWRRQHLSRTTNKDNLARGEVKGWRVGEHPARSHVMTEEEAGNDGVCPRLAGMQRMHKREQQHVTDRGACRSVEGLGRQARQDHTGHGEEEA